MVPLLRLALALLTVQQPTVSSLCSLSHWNGAGLESSGCQMSCHFPLSVDPMDTVPQHQIGYRGTSWRKHRASAADLAQCPASGHSEFSAPKGCFSQTDGWWVVKGWRVLFFLDLLPSSHSAFGPWRTTGSREKAPGRSAPRLTRKISLLNADNEALFSLRLSEMMAAQMLSGCGEDSNRSWAASAWFFTKPCFLIRHFERNWLLLDALGFPFGWFFSVIQTLLDLYNIKETCRDEETCTIWTNVLVEVMKSKAVRYFDSVLFTWPRSFEDVAHALWAFFFGV